MQYPENQQELQILVPGANVLATIADFDRNGEEMTLISYGFQAPGPCAVWMMVIAAGAARRDPTAISSPAPGQSRAPSRPSRSKGGLLPGGMLTLQQPSGTPGVSRASASALRSARLPVNLIGSPIDCANRLIGSPITSQSTGLRAP